MSREPVLSDQPEWRLANEMRRDLVRAGIVGADSARSISGNRVAELRMDAHGRVPGVRHLDEILKSIGMLR